MASAAIAQEAVLEVRNPRTGLGDHRLALSSAADVAAKAAQLRSNQRAWAEMPVEARCGIMARWLG